MDRGIATGTALGLISGQLFDNIALGTGIGLAIGAGIDTSRNKVIKWVRK